MEEDEIEVAVGTEDDLFRETIPMSVIAPTTDIPSPRSDPLDLEIDAAIEALRQRRELPPPEIRPRFVQTIENRRVEALLDGDYDGAAGYDQLAQSFQAALQLEEQKKSEDRIIELLFQRWQQLQGDRDSTIERWAHKISEFLSGVEQQIEILRDQHKIEVELFLDRWKDPAFLRPFSKGSTKLAELREQEHAMGLARMYSQAKEVRIIADRLQREETQAAQARINAQMATERHKLSEKHEKAIQALIAYRDRTVNAMEREKEKELRPIQTALQQLKAKKTLPSQRPSSLPALASRRSESACGSTAQDTLCSARTAARYSMFRAEKRAALLDVGPVDDATLAQMKNQPTARSRSKLVARTRPR
jgi:hypothetical protein